MIMKLLILVLGITYASDEVSNTQDHLAVAQATASEEPQHDSPEAISESQIPKEDTSDLHNGGDTPLAAEVDEAAACAEKRESTTSKQISESQQSAKVQLKLDPQSKNRLISNIKFDEAAACAEKCESTTSKQISESQQSAKVQLDLMPKSENRLISLFRFSENELQVYSSNIKFGAYITTIYFLTSNIFKLSDSICIAIVIMMVIHFAITAFKQWICDSAKKVGDYYENLEFRRSFLSFFSTRVEDGKELPQCRNCKNVLGDWNHSFKRAFGQAESGFCSQECVENYCRNAMYAEETAEENQWTNISDENLGQPSNNPPKAQFVLPLPSFNRLRKWTFYSIYRGVSKFIEGKKD